jgi:hypothetical protein
MAEYKMVTVQFAHQKNFQCWDVPANPAFSFRPIVALTKTGNIDVRGDYLGSLENGGNIHFIGGDRVAISAADYWKL